MTPLPEGASPRYTGAATYVTEDADGKRFYVYQGPNDSVRIAMEVDGACIDVTPADAGTGRPSLDCIPHQGLWLVGNKITGANNTPPRFPIPEYTPYTLYRSAPGGFDRLWRTPLVDGQVHALDLSRFGPASAYNLRLTISADRPGARVRLQPGPDMAAALTAITQVAGIRVYAPGVVNANDGQLRLFADAGPVNECFVDLLGWWG